MGVAGGSPGPEGPSSGAEGSDEWTPRSGDFFTNRLQKYILYKEILQYHDDKIRTKITFDSVFAVHTLCRKP